MTSLFSNSFQNKIYSEFQCDANGSNSKEVARSVTCNYQNARGLLLDGDLELLAVRPCCFCSLSIEGLPKVYHLQLVLQELDLLLNPPTFLTTTNTTI